MEVFAEYPAQIEHPQHCTRTAKVLDWVGRTFPALEPKNAWDKGVNYPLLHRIIDFNRAEKADCKSFWRKEL